MDEEEEELHLKQAGGQGDNATIGGAQRTDGGAKGQAVPEQRPATTPIKSGSPTPSPIQEKRVFEPPRPSSSSSDEESSSDESSSESESDDDPSFNHAAGESITVSDIATESVRLTWRRVRQRFVSMTGYRISLAEIEVGEGFQVYCSNTGNSETTAVVVKLKPGKPYRFHVAGMTAKGHVVPGSCQKSQIVYTLPSSYETAWYFEDEEDLKASWSFYTEERAKAQTMLAEELCTDVVLQFKAWRTSERCFSGQHCLKLSKHKVYDCGVFTDIHVKPGKVYLVHVRIAQQPSAPSRPAAVGEAPQLGTQLVVWDHAMRHISSEVACPKPGEWEHLMVRFTGSSTTKRARLLLVVHPEYLGDVFIDALELHPAEQSSPFEVLEQAMKASRVSRTLRLTACHVLNPKNVDSNGVAHRTRCSCKVYWNGVHVDTLEAAMPPPTLGDEQQQEEAAGAWSPRSVVLKADKESSANSLCIRVFDVTRRPAVRRASAQQRPSATVLPTDEEEKQVEEEAAPPPESSAVLALSATKYLVASALQQAAEADLPEYRPVQGEVWMRLEQLGRHPSARVEYPLLANGSVCLRLRLHDPNLRTPIGTLVTALFADDSASTPHEKLKALEQLAAYAVTPTGDLGLALRLKADLLHEGAVDELVALLALPQPHDLACRALEAFLRVDGSERTDAVCRLQLQSLVQGLGLMASLQHFLEDHPPYRLRPATLALLRAAFENNRRALRSETAAYPRVLEALVSLAAADKGEEGAEAAAALLKDLSGGKDVLPQVMDLYTKSAMHDLLPLNPVQWTSAMLRSPEAGTGAEAQAVVVASCEEEAVPEESFLEGLFVGSSGLRGRWRFLVAALDYSLQEQGPSQPHLLDEVGKEGDAARFWENVRLAQMVGVPVVTVLFLLSLVSTSIHLTTSKPFRHARCAQPVRAFLTGCAWLLVLMYASYHLLRAVAPQSRPALLRPCTLWLCVLLVLHAGFFLTGLASLLLSSPVTCPKPILRAGWLFMVTILLATLLVLVCGCCRRRPVQKANTKEGEGHPPAKMEAGEHKKRGPQLV